MISQILRKNKNNFYVLTGNFLEYFDLYMYVHLTHIIHKHYFIGGNQALLNAFTFANLYLFAPIGCIIFAYLGDTVGRKKVIVSTSILMAFCSSAIGILPTYHDIGAFAGVILITLRVFQGISLSGEPIAVLVYLVESTPHRYGPLTMAMISVTQSLGGAIALSVAYIAIDIWGEQIGWRAPFYLGVIFCFFSLWLRWHLAESKEYLEHTCKNEDYLIYKKMTILNFYRSLDLKSFNFFCLFGMCCASGVAFGIKYVYLGKFLIDNLGLTEHELLFHNLKFVLCEMALTLFSGFLVVGFDLNVKKFMIIRTLIFLCILPLLINMLRASPSVTIVMITQIALAVFFDRGIVSVSLLKVFPVIGRFSLAGIAMSSAKLFNFFMSGVVLNYISSFYSVTWLLVAMFPMTLIFLASVIFYIPYHSMDFSHLKKKTQLLGEMPVEEITP